MKTDLKKILSVSGKHGLYLYLAQARTGAIAEALSDKKRVMFDLKSRITSLADVSIYTTEGEMKIKDVFLALAKVYDSKPGPEKLDDNQLKAVFAKAVPDYDGSRFYVSHMKKVHEWYNELAQYASLDFEEEEEEPQDQQGNE